MSNRGTSLMEVTELCFQNGYDVNYCNSSGLNVILKAAHGGGTSPNLTLLDFLLGRDDISRIHKINALEMAGAVLLERNENHEKFLLAFQYWRRALSLRLMNTEDCRPLYKTPVKSKTGQLSEWTTLDDLQEIEQLPPDQRKIQSFLVQLRIFSSIGWSAVEKHIFESISEVLLNMTQAPTEGSISSFLDLTWITMETIFRCERPHEERLQHSVCELLCTLVYYFERVPKETLSGGRLKIFIELVLLLTDTFHSSDLHLAAMIDIHQLYHLLDMFKIVSMQPEMIDEEMGLSLLQLVHRDVRDSSGCNLLLNACHLGPSVAIRSTIRFLVKLRADPNARNNSGEGVLHILAMQHDSETRDATARLLLELGAHLDMANNEGLTAADLWLKKKKLEKKDVALLPDWLQESVPNLQCLSARVIRRHRLTYDDGAILPAVLIPFVTLH